MDELLRELRPSVWRCFLCLKKQSYHKRLPFCAYCGADNTNTHAKRDAAETALRTRYAALRDDAERWQFVRDNGLKHNLRAQHGEMELAFGFIAWGKEDACYPTYRTGGLTDELLEIAVDAARAAHRSETPLPESPAHD